MYKPFKSEKRNRLYRVITIPIAVLLIMFAVSILLPDEPVQRQTSDEFKTKPTSERSVTPQQAASAPAPRVQHERDPPAPQSRTFADTTGYTPDWAKGIGNNQILAKCNNLMMESVFSMEITADDKWCSEFQGYYMDVTEKELEDLEREIDRDLEKLMAVYDGLSP